MGVALSRWIRTDGRTDRPSCSRGQRLSYRCSPPPAPPPPRPAPRETRNENVRRAISDDALVRCFIHSSRKASRKISHRAIMRRDRERSISLSAFNPGRVQRDLVVQSGQSSTRSCCSNPITLRGRYQSVIEHRGPSQYFWKD
jgi:hypothetical protein